MITNNNSSKSFIPEKGELTAKLVAPQKIILFWDQSDLPKNIIRLFFNRPFEELVSVVRVYDVTDVMFNGMNAHQFYEIPVPYKSGYWFVKGLTANRSYLAEMGVHIQETGFFPVFRSNCIQTPAADIANGNDYHKELLQLKRYEESPPKWLNQVSTYSYYEETGNTEKKNA